MIGSSGLTKNVIDNRNYENLLIIDDEKLFKRADGPSRQGDDESHLRASRARPVVRPRAGLCKLLERHGRHERPREIGRRFSAGKNEGLRAKDSRTAWSTAGFARAQRKGHETGD